MATQTATITATSSAYISSEHPATHLSLPQVADLNDLSVYSAVLTSFPMPSVAQDKKISTTLTFSFRGASTIYFYINREKYDVDTVTYSTRPQKHSAYIWSKTANGDATVTKDFDFYFKAGDISELFKYGGVFDSLNGTIYTEASAYPPTLTVIYDDDISFYAVGDLAPVSTAKTIPTQLSWSLYDSTTGKTLGNTGILAHLPIYQIPAQTSATVTWRVASGQTQHTISAGANNYVTIPANTFTTDTVEWMVTATYSNGMTRSSAWQTLSTVDTIPTTTVLSPRSDIVDGTINNTFSWDYANASGSAPTGYEIETSTDGTTWTSLVQNLSSSDTYYTVPANTLTAGSLLWHVRGYNADGVAGDYSEPASIIVVSAPPAPAVSIVTTTARPTITWQTDGQQGFEIEIDGVSSGVIFGTQQTYTWPHYLDDGGHSVSVRVQNVYSMWSEWGGATFTVSNIAGDAITLTVTGGASAELSWGSTGNYSNYIVYRNGIKIAETINTSYTDDNSAGSVEYQVRGIDGDNYTLSNTASVTVSASGVIIKAIGDPEWFALKNVATSDRHNNINHSQNVSYQQYSGATYPMAVIGENRQKMYAFAVAFKGVDECKMFEDLLGKVVILKDQWQNVITGVLDGYSLDSTKFYQAYSCTIQQVGDGTEI